MGDHIASKDLEMNNKQILNSSGIAIGVAAISNGSVALQVDGSNKAILIPRITGLTAIATPENGMMVYNTADSKFYVRQGNAWVSFADGSGSVISMNGKIGAVTFEGDETTITVNNTGAKIVVSAKNASAIWNANKLNGNNVSSATPVSGQVLGWNGTQWMPVDMTANTALVVTNPAQPAITSVGTLSDLTVTAPIAGSVTGNAGTATKLATARSINGVLFDGTADITLPGTSGAGTLTGTTLSASVVNSSLTSVGTLSNLTVTNPIAGSITGNAATATTAAKLTTPRTINGVAFDGSANITIPAAADAGALTGATLNGNVVNSSLTSVGTLSDLTVTNPIAGSVTGNAGTATKLAASKTINGEAFDGSANIAINAVNIPNTPAGSVAALNVQAAITELDADISAKAPVNSPTFTGTVTLPVDASGVTAAPLNNSTRLATTAYVDAATVAGTPEASSTVKGRIQLAGDLTGTASAPVIAPGAVTTAKIADESITTDKIADANITTPNLADASVTTAKILDGTILAADLAAGAVTTGKILSLQVTTGKIAEEAVTAQKIASGAVTTSKILSVGNNKILSTDGTGIVTWVDKSLFETNSLTDGKILIGSDANVATEYTVSGDITLSNTGVAEIGANKVVTSMIAPGAVTLAQQANMATGSFIGRNTTGAGIQKFFLLPL